MCHALHNRSRYEALPAVELPSFPTLRSIHLPGRHLFPEYGGSFSVSLFSQPINEKTVE
jgi:hypothetical protein